MYPAGKISIFLHASPLFPDETAAARPGRQFLADALSQPITARHSVWTNKGPAATLHQTFTQPGALKGYSRCLLAPLAVLLPLGGPLFAHLTAANGTNTRGERWGRGWGARKYLQDIFISLSLTEECF